MIIGKGFAQLISAKIGTNHLRAEECFLSFVFVIFVFVFGIVFVKSVAPDCQGGNFLPGFQSGAESWTKV